MSAKVGSVVRRSVVLACAAFLAGCAVLGEESPEREATAPIARSPATAQCLTELGLTQATFTPLPDRYFGVGCSTLGSVKLSHLVGDSGEFDLFNIGPVTCPVANAFAAWARYGVDRAARQILGSPLQTIETMGSYSCRNIAGTNRRSAHSLAAAIDVSAFVLEDGRRISVLHHWSEGTRQEREFLRVVHGSACKRFATVLGPDYNSAHRDHLHIDGVAENGNYCR